MFTKSSNTNCRRHGIKQPGERNEKQRSGEIRSGCRLRLPSSGFPLRFVPFRCLPAACPLVYTGNRPTALNGWVGVPPTACTQKTKTRLCLTALKSVFWFFLGCLPKRTPFYYCVDMKTEVIGGNVSSPEINTIFCLRRQSCNNRYQLL